MRNTFLKRTLALFLVFVLAFTSLNLDWDLQTASAATLADGTTLDDDYVPFSIYFDESDNVFRDSAANDVAMEVYNSDGSILLDATVDKVTYVLDTTSTGEYAGSEYFAYIGTEADHEEIFDVTAGTQVYIKITDDTGNDSYEAIEYWR